MPKTPADLERKVDQLDNDVHEIYDMLTAITTKQREHDNRFTGIDGRLDGIDGRLDGIDGRLDRIDGRLDAHDARFDKVDTQLEKILTILGGSAQG